MYIYIIYVYICIFIYIYIHILYIFLLYIQTHTVSYSCLLLPSWSVFLYFRHLLAKLLFFIVNILTMTFQSETVSFMLYLYVDSKIENEWAFVI